MTEDTTKKEENLEKNINHNEEGLGGSETAGEKSSRPKSKGDKVEAEGTIIKALPNLMFDVKLSEDFGNVVVRAYLSGKMKIHYIKLIEGDEVFVELSPYDLTQGRIVFRK